MRSTSRAGALLGGGLDGVEMRIFDGKLIDADDWATAVRRQL